MRPIEDLPGKVLPGRDFIDPDKSAQDDHGHGTHVAGIAAAATDNGRGVAGIAPDARILPIKVLDAAGDSQGNSVRGRHPVRRRPGRRRHQPVAG